MTGKFMLTSEEHIENALLSIVRTAVSERFISSNIQQAANAPSPIDVRVAGKAADVSAEQLSNTPFSSRLTLSGMVTEVMVEAPLKAFSAREATVDGIT